MQTCGLLPPNLVNNRVVVLELEDAAVLLQIKRTHQLERSLTYLQLVKEVKDVKDLVVGRLRDLFVFGEACLQLQGKFLGDFTRAREATSAVTVAQILDSQNTLVVVVFRARGFLLLRLNGLLLCFGGIPAHGIRRFFWLLHH